MPNNSVVLEGGGTSFKCSVLPGAVYTWVHNGRKIDMKQADTKYTVQQDGLLEINQVVREDAGTYVCLAENKAGISAASATLSIGCESTLKLTSLFVSHLFKQAINYDTPLGFLEIRVAQSSSNFTIRK